MGENNDVPEIRSLNHDQASYVKFVNRTNTPIHLYWIDYEGQAVNYGMLSPGASKDIDTFVTHPWIFVDLETLDRFKVNQQDVFYPPPHSINDGMPRRIERAVANITAPLHSLSLLCLRAIKKRLKNQSDSWQLEIPRNLQCELFEMLKGCATDFVN